jgi:hypothetical protein
MDKFGIKGTLYDLIGYILPGLILMIGINQIFSFEKISLENLLNIKMTLPSVFILVALLYILGHVISSLSSVIFENYYIAMVSAKIYKFDSTKYDERAIHLFGAPYSKCSRIPIAFCQLKHPVIYETAFVFLSFYGMARNLATSMLIIFICWHIKFHLISVWSILGLVIISLLIHQYFRFKLYFDKQIATSLLVESGVQGDNTKIAAEKNMERATQLTTGAT